MALPSDKNRTPEAKEEKPDATVVTDGATDGSESSPDCTLALPGEPPPTRANPDATCVLPDEEEAVTAAPDTCRIAPDQAVPPTTRLRPPSQSVPPREQPFTLPDASFPARREDPPSTEAVGASLRDGTEVLTEAGEQRPVSPLDQTLQEPAPSEGPERPVVS